jgi:hypothetical protein
LTRFGRASFRWRNLRLKELTLGISRSPQSAKLTDETYLSSNPAVAKLPDSIITNIFTLQRRLVECIDATTAMEFRLFQEIGETAETRPELDELQNIQERLLSSHSRLYNLLLRVSQSQPMASKGVLDLLYESIELAEACLDTSIASLQDIQRNWN